MASQIKSQATWLVKKTWLLFALLTIGAAVLISLVRGFTPLLSDYKGNIEALLAEKLAMPVKVGSIHATWRGIHPSIRIENIQLQPQAHTSIDIQEIALGIDLLHSLLNWEMTTGNLKVSGMDLVLIEDDKGQFQVKGFEDRTPQYTAEEILEWLDDQRRITLNKISLIIQQNNGNKITVNQLNTQLTNRRGIHRLNGNIVINPEHKSQIKLMAKLKGPLDKKNKLTGKFTISAQNLSLQPWSKYLQKEKLKLAAGQANFNLDGRIEKSKLTKLKSYFLLDQAQVVSELTDKSTPIKQLLGELNWKRHGAKGWQLDVEKLHFIQKDDKWPVNHFTLIAEHDKQGKLSEMKVIAHYLRFKELNWILQNSSLLSNSQQKNLMAIKPQGEIHKINAILDFSPKLAIQSLAFDASNITIQAWKKIPGIKNISGKFKSKQDSGVFSLASEDTTLTFPKLFREPIHLKTTDGDIHWQVEDGATNIRVPNLQAKTALATLNAQMLLTIPDDGSSPVIELLGQIAFTRFGQQQLYNYLPVGVMPAQVVTWLDKSIKDSGAMDAALILRGPIKKYPFDDHSGTFLIDANVKNMNLDYYDGWPMLINMDGRLVFSGRSMNAYIDNGEIDSNEVKKLTANIPKMTLLEPVMITIDGDVRGELQQGIEFIYHSPLQATVGQRIEGLEAEGQMKVDLSLQIPLSQPKEGNGISITVLGNVDILEGEIDFPRWDLATDNVEGAFQFTEKGISAEGITGELFGYPAIINIASEKNDLDEIVTIINGQGQMSIEALADNYHLNINNYVDGETNYQLQLELAEKAGNRLEINSDLIGVTSTLPGPLAKPSSRPLPTQVELDFAPDTQTQLKFQIADEFNGLLSLNGEQTANIFNNGHIRFGTEKASKQTQSGLWIDGHIKSFTWGKDQKMNTTMKGGGMQSSLTFLENNLRGLNLQIDEVTLFDEPMQAVNVKLNFNDDAWMAQLSGKKIAGKVTMSTANDETPITIALDHLNLELLTKAEDEKITSNHVSFQKIPAINFACQDFQYGKQALGQVKLKLAPKDNGLAIEQLSVNSKSFKLAANGFWDESDGQQQTRFEGRITSKNVSDTLKELDMPDNLVSNDASMNFNLNWPNVPFAPSLNHISGEVSLLVKEGRIEGLSKETDAKLSLGRVITLLSLESLPRRLQLDFSDLTHKGYSFDSMKGRFILKDGNASTDDAFLDGTVAEVSMKGNIGLAKQDYNIELAVEPNITSSLPLVATIAGGPIAGIITWVIDQALSNEVKKLTRTVYKVEGSWEDPEVVPL